MKPSNLVPPRLRRITLERVARDVASDWEVPLESIRAQTRLQAYCWPRQIAQWIQYNSGYTIVEIGTWWGINHACVYNSVRKVNRCIKQHREFAAYALEFQKQFQEAAENNDEYKKPENTALHAA